MRKFNRAPFKSREIVYCKCEKKGHISAKCRIKRKINELKIDEDLK